MKLPNSTCKQLQHATAAIEASGHLSISPTAGRGRRVSYCAGAIVVASRLEESGRRLEKRRFLSQLQKTRSGVILRSVALRVGFHRNLIEQIISTSDSLPAFRRWQGVQTYLQKRAARR